MRLYLIRHARAGEAATDQDRRLSVEGVEEATHLAHRLRDLGVRWDAILTSPLVRARQTADILRAAALAPRVDEVGELAPGGELADWLAVLGAWRNGGRGDLAAVGHLPSLAAWAETLAFGAGPGRLVLRPAGLVALELPGDGALLGRSELFWLTAPQFLG